MEQLDIIKGTFKIIIFEGNNLYKVAKFKIDDKNEKIITVTGYFNELNEDTPYQLYGNYKEHYKYGLQFEVVRYEMVVNTDDDSLIRFFSSSLFPKIGIKAAKKIVVALGNDAVELIKKDFNIVYQIEGLTMQQKESIINGLKKDYTLNDSILFLSQNGLSTKSIMKLTSVYANEAVSIIKNNPYQMIVDIDGIGFKTADKIAFNLGFEESHPFRLKAAIIYILNNTCMSTGNTYIITNELYSLFNKKFLYCDYNDFMTFLHELENERRIKIESEKVFLITQYDAEVNICKYLKRLDDMNIDKVDSHLLHEKIKGIESALSIQYEDKQKQAILSVFDQPFSIITGGPGTGKTTIVRAIINLYKEIFPEDKIGLCAPTGRAAKRLSELCNEDATTIHSLLKWDLESNTFGMNEMEPLDIDLLIIDEFSMVDSYLFYNLLRASTFIKRIILIGDEDQLPSVGPGFVLKDLITSKLFNITCLNKIFRQKEGSDIVELASEIKHGLCDILNVSKEVKMFACANFQVKEQIQNIMQNAFDKGYTISDIQVLAPMYNGVAGIDSLNKSLQEQCNPYSQFKKELKLGYRTLRVDDKVLQLKNQPDDNIYNGDIGIIIDIQYASEDYENQNRIIVDFDGNIVEYTSDNFNVITHAYCISIHKSQGSEYPIVIMPILSDYMYMLQRRLIYTGITRAKKSLVLLGDKTILEKGINKESRYPRNTTLVNRLIQFFE